MPRPACLAGWRRKNTPRGATYTVSKSDAFPDELSNHIRTGGGLGEDRIYSAITLHDFSARGRSGVIKSGRRRRRRTCSSNSTQRRRPRPLRQRNFATICARTGGGPGAGADDSVATFHNFIRAGQRSGVIKTGRLPPSDTKRGRRTPSRQIIVNIFTDPGAGGGEFIHMSN